MTGRQTHPTVSEDKKGQSDVSYQTVPFTKPSTCQIRVSGRQSLKHIGEFLVLSAVLHCQLLGEIQSKNA